MAKLVTPMATASLAGGAVEIYDKKPDPLTYPSIRVGDDQAVGDSNACADGWEFFATLHIFSRHPTDPRPEVKHIADIAAQALGNNASLPAPTGFDVLEVELQQSRSFMEGDGVTAHGVLTLRYVVDEA